MSERIVDREMIMANDDPIVILKEALAEHERTWGEEAFTKGDWASRARKLIAQSEPTP